MKVTTQLHLVELYLSLLLRMPLCVHVGSNTIYIYKICFRSNDKHLHAELFHLHSEHNFFITF